MKQEPGCADCERNWGRYRKATILLPEGRYLCNECWLQLRELRRYVISGGKS